MTPPASNPMRWAAQRYQHWANPVEIKPGVWQVEEGSGPRATTRRLAVVKPSTSTGGWSYFGHVSVRYGYATLDAYETASGRKWRIEGPGKITGELVEQLIALAKEHA